MRNRIIKKQVHNVEYQLDEIYQIIGVTFKLGYLDHYFLPVDDYFLHENDFLEVEIFENKDEVTVVSAYIPERSLCYLNKEFDNFNYYTTRLFIYLAYFVSVILVLFFLSDLKTAGILGALFFILNFGLAFYMLYRETKNSHLIKGERSYTNLKPFITENGIASECIYFEENVFDEIVETEFLYKAGVIDNVEFFETENPRFIDSMSINQGLPQIIKKLECFDYSEWKRVTPYLAIVRITIDDQIFYAYPNELVFLINNYIHIVYKYNEALQGNLILFVSSKNNMQTDKRLKSTFERFNLIFLIFFGLMALWCLILLIFMMLDSNPIGVTVLIVFFVTFFAFLLTYINFRTYVKIKKSYNNIFKIQWLNNLKIKQGFKFIFYY